MLKQTFIGAVVLALALGLTACGSSTKTTVQNTDTQGQQLLDLKEAYDKGVISEKEYKRAKSKILKQ
ncbi:MAG: SHOCT domain-containing protein [Halioglobus sp.]